MYKKYLKYKEKYLRLKRKNQQGGVVILFPDYKTLRITTHITYTDGGTHRDVRLSIISKDEYGGKEKDIPFPELRDTARLATNLILSSTIANLNTWKISPFEKIDDTHGKVQVDVNTFKEGSPPTLEITIRSNSHIKYIPVATIQSNKEQWSITTNEDFALSLSQ